MTKWTGAWVAAGLALAGCGDRNASQRMSAGDALAAQAEAAITKGDFARALAAADLAASYDPLNPARRDLVLRARLTSLVRLPDTVRVDDAAAWDLQAETMTSRDPDRASMYLTARGLVLLSRSAEQAKSRFEEALAKDATFAPAHIGLATALASLGKRDEAVTALEKALAAEPENALALSSLGRLQLEKNENEKGLASIEKAVKLRPDDASAHQNYAIALWRAKRQDDAGKAIQRAAQLDPKSASIRLELANWLKETGQADAAFEQYGIAGQLGAEPNATFARGLLLFQAKQYAEAAKSFDAAAVNRMPSALYESGRAYEAAGDAQTAAARYQKFVQTMGSEASEKERVADAQGRLGGAPQ